MPNLDQVTLVDENDNPIGSMDKIKAHLGKGKLHRAISVFLFQNQKLLIQQRSEQKIVGAHLWANTVCGNVRPNESYQDCAYRRLKEELAITQAKIKPIYKFRYQVKCNSKFSENEIDQVFIGFYDGQVSPNPDEVQGYIWVDFTKLLNKEHSYQLAPWFEIMLKDKKLIDLLLKFR